MADTPPFAIRFRYRASDDDAPGEAPVPAPEEGLAQRHDRVEVYQHALDFAARAYVVLEHAEAERFYLRDQLDRKSAILPQLVAQALATADMTQRRALYLRARQALTDCAAILDILAERGIVKLDVLAPAARWRSSCSTSSWRSRCRRPGCGDAGAVSRPALGYWMRMSSNQIVPENCWPSVPAWNTIPVAVLANCERLIGAEYVT